MGRATNSANRTGLALCLLAALLFANGCRAIEHRILYAPDSAAKSWSQPTSDELAGLCFEDACFSSTDGVSLHGWFIHPAGEVPAKAILFAHGRSGNISSLKPKLFDFVRNNQAAVLVFDYRGYGKSAGVPSEEGLYNDVAAARDWLAGRVNIPPGDVVLMGRSMGAAVATDLAVRDGAKALVIESTFTSIPDLVRHYSRGVFTGKRLQSSYNSIDKIGCYDGPMFISHGKRDKLIPFSHGVRLANAATGASSVHFVELEGGHKAEENAAYDRTLTEFLDNVGN